MAPFRLARSRRDVVSARDPIANVFEPVPHIVVRSVVAAEGDSHVTVVAPPSGFSDEERSHLRSQGFGPAALAVPALLDIAGFQSPEEYARVMARARGKWLERLLDVWQQGGGEVEISTIAAMTAATLSRFHDEVLLHFRSARSFESGGLGFAATYLRTLAALQRDADGFVLHLMYEGRPVGFMVLRVLTVAALFDDLRTEAGTGPPVELSWSRTLAPHEEVVVSLFCGVRREVSMPQKLRAGLSRLLWWHAVRWAIERRSGLFSGGVHSFQAGQPYIREALLQVSAAKRELGMRRATVWSPGGAFWRPARARVFVARGTIAYPWHDGSGWTWEYLLSDDPVTQASMLLERKAPFVQRVFVTTRADARAVEELCDRTETRADVRVWREF